MVRIAHSMRGRRGKAARPPSHGVPLRLRGHFIRLAWRQLLHLRPLLGRLRADVRVRGGGAGRAGSHTSRSPIRGGVLAAAVVLAAVLAGCGGRAEYESLHGAWRFDAATQEWLPRACVVLDFDANEEPGFEVERRGEEYRVRLNDHRGTTFHGAVRDGVFDSRQLLPTSTTGRFCGSNTTLHLRLNLRGSEPGTLRGMWHTPDCGVCPDRNFGGERAEP